MDGESRRSRSWVSNPTRAVAGALVALVAGCRSVPGERFDDCRKLNDTLRTENARLRDQTASLSSQNQDMAERAVDDARKLHAQEQAVAQLERSVQAYQDERDELEVAVKQLKQSLSDSAPRTRACARGSGPKDSPPQPDAATPR